MKTVDDFWLMVYQQNSSTVCMLCNCIEMSRDKSWQYWPLVVGHIIVLGESREVMGLKVTMVNSEDRGRYIIKAFNLTNSSTVIGVKRTIKQYHYMTWPDLMVPKSPGQFLECLLDVRKTVILVTLLWFLCIQTGVGDQCVVISD